MHANLDPNHKKKDEKQTDRKKKRKAKAEIKKVMDNETAKSSSKGKPSINTSEENFTKPVTDDDDKDSIESSAALPINGSEKSCCSEKECISVQPSKIRKLSNSDNG